VGLGQPHRQPRADQVSGLFCEPNAPRTKGVVRLGWPRYRQSRLAGAEAISAELLPVPAFDAEALLPQPLRDWVLDKADRMPCPPDYIAAAAVVELGSVIGARCAIRPKSRDDWEVVPNLWGGDVGLPST
jgi:hypothetical protein